MRLISANPAESGFTWDIGTPLWIETLSKLSSKKGSNLAMPKTSNIRMKREREREAMNKAKRKFKYQPTFAPQLIEVIAINPNDPTGPVERLQIIKVEYVAEMLRTYVVKP